MSRLRSVNPGIVDRTWPTSAPAQLVNSTLLAQELQYMRVLLIYGTRRLIAGVSARGWVPAALGAVGTYDQPLGRAIVVFRLRERSHVGR